MKRLHLGKDPGEVLDVPKVMIIFGTRPEAIKLAPVVRVFSESPRFTVSVAVTAQHKEMLYQVMNLFRITADFDLDVMKPRQNLCELSGRLLHKLQALFSKERPDMVIVQGDTTTTFIGALAAFYARIPVAHVEAGLRSSNKYHPYPEEINRILTSNLAELHFAPTDKSKENLLRQGIRPESIYQVGNTIIDSLNLILKSTRLKPVFKERFVLVTAHRRENWGRPIENLCLAIKNVAQTTGIRFIFSVHKNPMVRETVWRILGDVAQVHLVEPLDYDQFIHHLEKCHFILSDSGGVQEEAPVLGKPVLVFRDTTERPEGVSAGAVRLIGREAIDAETAMLELLRNPKTYDKMSRVRQLYGDGTSSKKILQVITEYFDTQGLDRQQPSGRQPKEADRTLRA